MHAALETCARGRLRDRDADAGEMRLQEPQIVRQGGRYGVRTQGQRPSIHMVMANIETEVSPAIGGEKGPRRRSSIFSCRATTAT